jgi:NAD(P)-dependent dehydrogenase (short-subunit alcohol dehydrogenase family)
MSEPAILIIGAAGGIGSATARRLSAQGARLTLCGRDPASLERLSKELGGEVVETDARDSAAVEKAVRHHVDSFGSLDGIVNCAGSILLKPAHITSDDEYHEVIATNLTTAFNTVKSAARQMVSQKKGSIVLVSSAAAQHGLVNHDAIAAAKGGVAALTRSAAATYAHRNVRVNAVSPGLVETPATERITSSSASLEQSKAMHALGRIGQPEDIAASIAWLLDAERSGWITGQVIGIDGGLSRLAPRPA